MLIVKDSGKFKNGVLTSFIYSEIYSKKYWLGLTPLNSVNITPKLNRRIMKNSDFKKALELVGIRIRKFSPEKQRPILTDLKSYNIGGFSMELSKSLGSNIVDFPEIFKLVKSPASMEAQIKKFCEEENIEISGISNKEIVIPQDLSSLTLNLDRSSKEWGNKRYFCTTKEEFIDHGTSGQFYIDLCRMSAQDAASLARSVIPKYIPRGGRGVVPDKNPVTGTTHDFFNVYIPAEWKLWKDRNPDQWDKIPDSPPDEIIRTLKHLIPDRKEREYLYAWIYTSLTSRSFVYLVLCGDPGVGKNRLKLLINALHGKTNLVDGKKETFGANESKFNSQMENNTLVWFDELKYGPDMEPRMKEYQNTNIAIEKKGVDATQSSEIYSSMVISNNYPRDNYLLFNSRKFAPLVLGTGPLTQALNPDEIAAFSAKLDVHAKTFDVRYAAQIAKWILKIGKKYLKDWPNLEYQGPKFWELAHSSMSRWQKIAVQSLTTKTNRGPFPGWDERKKAYLWSKVEEALRRKKEYESKDYRDPNTVRNFFESYRDTDGKIIFDVEIDKRNVVHDFWIKPKSGVVKNPPPREVPEGENDFSGLHRPPGISGFQWRKMQEAHLLLNNAADKDSEELTKPEAMSEVQWQKMKLEREAGRKGLSNGKGKGKGEKA